MGTLTKSLLLFAMNWIDAGLTVLWLRLNVATEGNSLMARVLAHGEIPFLSVKIVVGGFAAYILYRCAHLRLAKHGMTFVLALYLGLMLIHAATGCAALGWNGPELLLVYLGSLPRALFS
ncbi:MAG TPA: DUF5658 family protein [Pyrinomonadaceae bacterium]|nr:DUF5658 family protein [Pyrinomonadaceae bacterium]